MAYLLGWKDILRPIRDGYRHMFPTPDTGPTPEERRKQRELDRLKGFTYFDTFDQLESWTEAESDPLQRANTPLLRGREEGAREEFGKADVLLIHDCSGNYHDYESAQNTGVDAEPYSCEYLQHVDTFIYFSHKLICVPPPTWTNTLHRNGVKVLGTVLVEPQTQGSERVLHHDTGEDGTHFPMVEKLAHIAAHYGFDGWLINIEKTFPPDVWDPYLLETFLCQLKTALGETRQLVWYDALTTSNKISYQNALNDSNSRFAEACGSILTNYCWTEADAEKSVQFAMSSKLLPRNIYFGVDVWAQNKSSFTQPRVTYPEYGGGGTNTGVAVAKLAELGLSVGIFAPAWSFEHFPGHGRGAERAVWEGALLPKGVDCSCGDCASRHRPNEEFAVIKHARERATGSTGLFYTDFSCAFGTNSEEEKYVFGGYNMHAQLGAQSLLPRPAIPRSNDQALELTRRLEHVDDRTRLIVETTQLSPIGDKKPEQWLPLYKLNMNPNFLRLEMRCHNLLPSTGGVVVCIYYIRTDGSISQQALPVGYSLQTMIMHGRDVRVKEFGIYLGGSPTTAIGETVRLLEVREIRIVPLAFESDVLHFTDSIHNIRLEDRGQGENRHTRLCWGIDDTMRPVSKFGGMPFSEITGLFSHFAIRIDGLKLGRAYALEYVLNGKLVERITGREVNVVMTGVGFDGRTLAEESTHLRLQQPAASVQHTGDPKR